MSDQYLQQLRSADPAIRRAAIIALADSRDPKAPEYLAQAAKSDPSTSLRMLAERAHRHALRKSWRSITTEDHESSPSETWYSHAEKANAEINDSQRRARSQLHNAQGSSVNGDTRGALNYLINAFELDPALRYDKEAMALTAELTGQPVDQAVDLLMDGIKKKEQREGPTPFWTLMGYITLESIVLFLLLAGMSYLLLWTVSHNAISTPNTTAEVRGQLARLGGSLIVPNAALLGGVQLVGYIVYFVIMFGVAMIMGGFGTIFDFINVMLRVYIVITLVSIGILGLFVAAKPTASNFAGLTIVLGLVNICVVAYFASREMEFGFFRGLLTVFAPQILACMVLVLLIVLDMGKVAAQFFSGLPS